MSSTSAIFVWWREMTCQPRMEMGTQAPTSYCQRARDNWHLAAGGGGGWRHTERAEPTYIAYSARRVSVPGRPPHVHHARAGVVGKPHQREVRRRRRQLLV